MNIADVPSLNVILSPNDAEGLVSDHLGTISGLAADQLGAAQGAIAAAAGANFSFELPPLELPDLSALAPDFELPSPPSRPVLPMDVGEIDAPDEIDLGDAGAFAVAEFAEPAPDVGRIDAPSYREPPDPGDPPALDTAVNLPDVPDADIDGLLAKIDDLIDVEIPSFDPVPVVDLPSWDATLPKIDVEAPGSIFAYNESAMDTALIERLKAEITGILDNGGTGLGAAVEAALWDRAMDRMRDQFETRRNQTLALHAGAGWDMPQGATEAALFSLENELARSLEGTNHEQTIEQARLAQAHHHKALDAGTALAQVEAEAWNRMRDRALAAAKAAAEDAATILNLKIAAANYELERYRTEAQVYEAQIRAAIARLDVYRAKLDAQRAQVEIKRVNADLIGAQVAAIEGAYRAYDAQVRAALGKVEIEKAKIDAYGAEIEAYKARWAGVTAKIGAYQAEMAGEQAKADIFRSQVAGYEAYVRGKLAQSQVVGANADLKAKEAEVNARNREAAVREYGAKVQARAAEIDGVSRGYAAQMQGYSAQAGAMAAANEAKGRIAIANAQNSLAAAEIAAKSADSRLQSETQRYGVEVEKLKGIAAVSSQLASSIFSALNVGASVSSGFSRSTSNSYGYSQSLGNSKSLNHNYTFGEE